MKNGESAEPWVFSDEGFKSSFSADRSFDLIYPDWVQKLSDRHWTPAEVARQAARFLVTEPGTRVLDIGCGPGKFCAVGAASTSGCFTGIEHRDRLVSVARRTVQKMGLSERVKIIQGDIIGEDFSAYDAFYYFNPFFENILPFSRIDSSVELQRARYTLYTGHVRDQLAQAPRGTRLATYHSDPDEVPDGYHCWHQSFNGYLKLWIKDDLTTTGSGTGSSF
jgi:SAM-dependent methyltransferase